MTTDEADLPPDAVRRAARRFTGALAGEEMLAMTARVEAWLAGENEALLFAMDRALAAAWPQGPQALPRHEVIWAPGGEGRALRFCAYDADGRVLLRRSYDAELKPQADGHA